MKTWRVLMLPIVVGLTGCAAAPQPVAENFPYAKQQVARSVQHWNVVAEDVVSETLKMIAEKQQLQGRSLYVSPARNTAFNSAFRDFLITRFVGRGAEVSVCRNADGKPGFATEAPEVEIQYETQVIGHGAGPVPYVPGEFTALASGIAVARNINHSHLSRGQGNLAMLGAGILLDLATSHMASPTRTEIVVTTTIADRNRFVMRRSDIYYVPDADASLYFRRVAYRSAMCPSEKPMASIALQDDVDSEIARREAIVRDMRRINPEWRGMATPASYYR